MRDALKLKFGLKSDKNRGWVKMQNWSSSFAIGDLDFQSLLLLLCLHFRWNSSSATYGRDFSSLVVLKLNYILANSVRDFVCLFFFFFGLKPFVSQRSISSSSGGFQAVMMMTTMMTMEVYGFCLLNFLLSGI
jgi:hypothetical protein